MSEHHPQVLVVEDDLEFQRLLSTALASNDLAHVAATSCARAGEIFDAAPNGSIDLILLDLVLPDGDGLDLLRSWRARGKDVPVIVVSGRETVDMKVRALSSGADDYVVKPFRVDELLARIHAVMRRRQGPAAIEVGELRLDRARRRTARAGNAIDLSPREFDLLVALAEARGRTLSRDELLTKVWDTSFGADTNVLDVHLGRLRKKLDRHGRPAIRTVRGQGYCLALENLAATSRGA